MASFGFVYGFEPNLSAAEFRRVLVASGLIARDPAENLDRLDLTLRATTLIVTARAYTPERALLGVARVLTDYSHSAYVPLLAVARPQQRNGIGRGLLAALREKLGDSVSVVLTGAPGAEGFYSRIGMHIVPNAYRYEQTNDRVAR